MTIFDKKFEQWCKKKFLRHYISNIQNKPSIDNKNNSTIFKAFNLPQWNYTIELFRRQKTTQRIFRNGFFYLNSFENAFYNNPQRIYYQHNPILSSLLCSRIIGAVFVLVFLIISFYYGLIYFKKHTIFFLWCYSRVYFLYFLVGIVLFFSL